MSVANLLGVERWRLFTLLEALRLRETLWGPLDDLSESRRAQAAGGTFAQRLLHRAQYVAQRESWCQLWDRWLRVMAGLSLLFALVAAFTGSAAALGALGNGTRAVNVVLVLLALLGLHSLTFLFWLLSVCWPRAKVAAASWVTDLCFYLSQRLVRGPDAALIPQALGSVLARAQARVWCFGVMSHFLWLVALIAAFGTTLALLMARSYQFNWETTLLDPTSFVWWAETLGALPRLLGFAMPDASAIRLSDGTHALDASVQTLWSSWLLGVLLVYGILPRLLALVLSIWRVRRLAVQLTVDESLPGLATLRSRLFPAVEPAGVDGAAGADYRVHWQPDVPRMLMSGSRAMVGLEWPVDQTWPPPSAPLDVYDLGRVDSRAERLQVVAALQAQSPALLIMVCNASLTPDRGTIATLLEWAQLAQQSKLVLLADRVATAPERLSSWRSRLLQAGFSTEQIQTEFHGLDRE